MKRKTPDSCHRRSAHKGSFDHPTVLLMGLPNVGKSALFTRLTGIDIMVSNYAGTTVEFCEGAMVAEQHKYTLIDVPGTYNMHAENEAERVAVEMMKQKPAAVICVLDAINLECSIHLLLQLFEYDVPILAALNRIDLAQDYGLTIDKLRLKEQLGIEIIETVAVKKQGIDQLTKAIDHTVTSGVCNHCTQDAKNRWSQAESIAKKCITRREKLVSKSDCLVKPWPGLFIAGIAMSVMFGLVIGVGMGIRRFLLLPLFRDLLFPWITATVEGLVEPLWLQNILIGEYGFLIKGIEWPFALVLPYVVSFYIALSIVEDSGYLPRLGVLLDGLFRKIGLNGSAIIPLLLGYGCGIPAILATRSLPSRKQRIILSSMVCFAVPCVSQTGAFISLLSERSIGAVVMVFVLSIFAMIGVGLALDKSFKGEVPYTLMEVPALLIPNPGTLLKKVYLRIKRYMADGALPMIVAVMAASLLYELGILSAFGRLMAPLVSGWLNMPNEATVPLILGIVRRELTVLPLMDMELTTIQFFTGATVALFYVPCIAMIATLAKEFSVKTAVIVLLSTTGAALFLGGLIAQIGRLTQLLLS